MPKPTTTRQQKSRKITEDKAKKKRWRALTRRLALVAAIGLLLTTAAAGWGIYSTGQASQIMVHTKARFYATTSRLGFTVQRIFLEGRRRTPMTQVVEKLGVHMGDPIFGVSAGELRQRLESIDSVKYAEVERRLPGTLHIYLTERAPVAIWQNAGTLSLLDDRGHVMEEEDISQFASLPVVVGEDAPSHVEALFAILANEPDLAREVKAALWVGERRWDLRLRSGIEVKLPEQDAEAAITQLARMQTSEKLLARNIRAVDMRIPKRIYIRLGEGVPPPKPPRSAIPGNET